MKDVVQKYGTLCGEVQVSLRRPGSISVSEGDSMSESIFFGGKGL